MYFSSARPRKLISGVDYFGGLGGCRTFFLSIQYLMRDTISLCHEGVISSSGISCRSIGDQSDAQATIQSTAEIAGVGDFRSAGPHLLTIQSWKTKTFQSASHQL